jgi:hypothetical protein
MPRDARTASGRVGVIGKSGTIVSGAGYFPAQKRQALPYGRASDAVIENNGF